MSAAVTLRPRSTLPRAIEASCIAPDRFVSLSEREIGALPVWSDAEGAGTLGDYFSIKGERAATIHCEGDLAGVDRLGHAMAGGELVVEGSAGTGTGSRMSGGRVTVKGAVGRDGGLEMRGGALLIHGSAGCNLGGAGPGVTRGMTGGVIVVHGAADAEAAARMRRGVIYVAGAAGPFAGRGMIAGTLVVAGEIARGAGHWSKRGSIVAFSAVARPATFRLACTYRPPHIAVLLRHLRTTYQVPVQERHIAGLYRRYSGDLAELGKGEILEWTAP
jgi:formylmethanofuran dehydrogenase subunit C